MTVGTTEVPATAAVKIRAAPVVTIGNTTENAFLRIKKLWDHLSHFTSTAVIFTF